MLLQQASWRDLGPIRTLEKLCFPQDSWPLLDMLGVLSLPNITTIKAQEGENIVGFVAGDAKRWQQTGWISTICVHPESRGIGLGSMLLDLCEEKMDMPKVKLSVRESNKRAISLYLRRGYQQVGRWRRYYKGEEDAVVMEKMIEDSQLG